MGDVIGDLNSRRGMVGEFIDKPANMKLIKVCMMTHRWNLHKFCCVGFAANDKPAML